MERFYFLSLVLFIYFFAAENYIVSIWFEIQERAPRWLNWCLVAAERGFREKPRHQRGSSKSSGLQKLLVVLEGEVFEDVLAQPSLGTRQPAEAGQMVTHLLDELHLLIQEVFSRKSQRWDPSQAKPRACRSRRAWFRFFSKRMAASIPSWILPHSS